MLCDETVLPHTHVQSPPSHPIQSQLTFSDVVHLTPHLCLKSFWEKPLCLSGLLYEGGGLGRVVVMAGKGADPWADVDFDEVQEATCLEVKANNQISRG